MSSSGILSVIILSILLTILGVFTCYICYNLRYKYGLEIKEVIKPEKKIIINDLNDLTKLNEELVDDY